MQELVPVGVLGATGAVGQRLLQLLSNHSQFRLIRLGASDQSAGKPYHRAVKWLLDSDIPCEFRDMTIVRCTPGDFSGCRLVFSALSSGVAGPTETEFAVAGFGVFSNAKDHRSDEDVPVLVPAVNGGHLERVKTQATFPSGGFIVTKANCSTAGLVIGIAPLVRRFGIDSLFVATLQALSGAGYPGVPSLDIADNVIPFIADEEEKLQSEPAKILDQAFPITAHCTRVPVTDGHTLCVSVHLSQDASLAQVVSTLQDNEPYKALQAAYPHTFNYQSLHILEDRPPQPRLDRMRGNGLTTTIGRIRGQNRDFSFVIVSHNTLIGAASAGVKAAELALESGLVLPHNKQ